MRSMTHAKKLWLNLGWRALLVLGATAYLRYLIAFLRNCRSILRAGNFKPLDRAMGSRPITIRMNGKRFVLDCPYTDERINDGTFTFGIVREMYMRNCYLRHGVTPLAKTARTILDLGANRGAFSLMMARQADLVIAVEANPIFKEVIAHNMAVNGFTNFAVETVFAGSGGKCDHERTCHMTIPQLLQKHGVANIDLLKMDIEGSEFDLFRSPEWLDRVSAICMEVHPEFGEPRLLVETLDQHTFSFVVTDSLFRPVEDLKRAEFIYAWKKE